MTCLAAEALQQARGDGRALAGAADDRDGLGGVDAVGDVVGCRGRARGRSRGCSRCPTRSARARRGPAGRRRRVPSDRAARGRSSARRGRRRACPRARRSCRRRGSRRCCAGRPRRRAARPRWRPSSSRPTSTMGCSGLASQASLEPNPARRAVMQTAPGMCASSNCSSVRTSTTSAPSAWACWTWRGLSGCASTVSLTSGPRLSATMFLKFGGCGPSVEVVFSTNSSSSVTCSSVLVGALEADGRGDLEVHAGSAAQRPAEMPRPHLDGVGQAHELVVEGVEDAARAFFLVDGEVGAGDVADEQGVAGQDRPRLV